MENGQISTQLWKILIMKLVNANLITKHFVVQLDNQIHKVRRRIFLALLLENSSKRASVNYGVEISRNHRTKSESFPQWKTESFGSLTNYEGQT